MSVVLDFKNKTSGIILIAMSECSRSMPGVLKNAIHLVSKPYEEKSFEGKPVSVMSISHRMLEPGLRYFKP
ncbi:MAG: NAD(P)H-dependent oxidoreductase [Thermoproteota archaeon]